MRLKRLFSTLFLSIILISSFSFPVNSYAADDCQVIVADFLGKPNGPNWYKDGKTIQMEVAINDSEACKDKKIQFQILAKTGKSSMSVDGFNNLEEFKSARDITFEPGTKVMHSPFEIKEEKCYDLDQNDIEEEIASNWLGGAATNVSTLVDRLGITHDQFIDKVYPVLKEDKSGFATLKVDGKPLYDKATLTKETTQAVLNNIDSIDFPGSDWSTTIAQYSSYPGLNLAFGGIGIIANLSVAEKTDMFQDQVAKQILFGAGIYDCNYKIQTRIGETDTWKDQGGISYMCDFGNTAVGNECSGDT